MSRARELLRRRWQEILYWTLLVGVAATGPFIHSSLGFKYPVPWPDEGSFVWPAVAFADNTSLLAPELNTETHIFWMPPGYMVVQGLIFKVTGFSLAWARILSAVYLAGAVIGLGAIVAKRPGRFAYLPAYWLFLHCPIALLAGNTARMEPLLLFVIVGGFLLLHRGFLYAGNALLLMGPLIHPIGALGFLGGALYALPLAIKDRAKPRRWELGLIVAAVLAWAAYGIYVGVHFADFKAHMSHQLWWKGIQAKFDGGYWGRLKENGVLVPAVLLVISAIVARRREVLVLVALAFPLLLQAVVTVGWMYDVYIAFLYVVAAMALAEALLSVTPERWKKGWRLLAGVGVIGVAVSLAQAHFLNRTEFVNRSVRHSIVLRIPLEPPYFTEDDHRAVSAYLADLKGHEEPLVVQFLPDADALLYADQRRPGLRFSHPHFHESKSDVYVFHESVWVPKAVRDNALLRLFARHHVPDPVERWQYIHGRGQTERWVVWERPGKVKR